MKMLNNGVVKNSQQSNFVWSFNQSKILTIQFTPHSRSGDNLARLLPR